MKILYLILFYICTGNLYPQASLEWVKRFNGTENRFDIATTMKLDAFSNVYVYGTTASTGTLTDIAAVKYNSAGTELWRVTVNGYSNSVDQSNDAVIDEAGNSYITGFTADTNQTVKPITIKTDNSGNVLWSRVFLPPAYLNGSGEVILTGSGGAVYTIGNLRRANGSFTLALLKYSSNGSLVDTAYFNGTLTSSEIPVSACIDSGGNIFILASTNAVSAHNDILMLKYNSSLELLWQLTFSGTGAGSDQPVEIMITNDNKLAVTAAMFNQGSGLDYGMFRFDTNSTLIMQYYYNGTGNHQDIPYAITCDNSNNIYVTGSSRNSDTLGSEDFLTMKIDPTGTLIWQKRYNGTGRGIDYGTSIAVDAAGNVYAGGTTDKFDIHVAYALLKYGPSGNLFWLEEYSGQENSEDFVYKVAVDNSYNVFVTGISFDSVSDYDIATLKYSQPIGIQTVSSEVPVAYKLLQNYPNPFNPVTNFRFQIPVSGNIKITVYDASGRESGVLLEQNLNAGSYEYRWDASGYPSGVYFYSLSVNGFRETKKMALVK